MKVIKERYEVIREIEKGGFATTYLGRDTMLGMDVAIKEYYETDETKKAKLIREARNLAKFSQEPGIVNVRDFMEEDGKVYMIMEYLDGQDLKHFLSKNGTMSIVQAYQILRPIMITMNKLHNSGLLHRDISPDNLRMLPDGRVKLLDFGAALEKEQTMQDKTVTAAVKPGYAPWEQYASASAQGPWTDVYGVCATIYKCITGKTPIDSLQRVFHDELKTPSQLGVTIDPQVEAVLMQGLAVRPEMRIRNFPELLHKMDLLLLNPAGNAGATENASSMQRRPVPENTRPVNTGSRLNTGSVNAQAPVKDVPVKEQKISAKAERKAERKTERKTEKKPRSKGSAAGKVKIILGGLAGVAVVAGAVFYFTTGSKNPYYSANGNSAVRKEHVTKKMIAPILKDQNTDYINFSYCSFDDDVFDALAESKYLTGLGFSECFGIENFKKLQDMKSLEKLSVSYPRVEENGDHSDPEKLLEGNFPQIKDLSLSSMDFSSDSSVLKGFNNLTSLYISEHMGWGHIQDYSFLEDMKDLEELHLYHCDLKGQTDYLKDHTKLKRVFANGSGMDSLDWTENSTQLTTLELNADEYSSDEDKHAYCYISDLSPLNNCKELVYLKLNHNQISEIPEDFSLPKLYELDLSYNKLTSLGGLGANTHLKLLDLSYNEITDLTSLENLVNVDTFNARGNVITSVDPISGWKDLRRLNLGENQLDNVRSLSSMERMVGLQLDHNNITNLDGCEYMTKLTTLKAGYNQISDITALRGCTEMTSANLRDNLITDISIFDNGFTKLNLLVLDNNEITTLNPLATCDSLNAVSVAYNNLTDLKGLEGKESLYGLAAHHNQITDVSAITNCVQYMHYLDLGENKITDVSPLSEFLHKSNGSSSSSNMKAALYLQNNNISDLSAIPDCQYQLLSVYGNPIPDYSFANDMTGIAKAKLYIPFLPDADYSGIGKLNGIGVFSGLFIVDCPTDQRAKTTAAYKLCVEGTAMDPTFYTAEGADKAIDDQRNELASTILGRDN